MPPTPRPRAWIAFFAVLVVLAVTGVVLPIVYNLGLQLKPEALDEARALWAEAGPADYDLSFSVAYDNDRLAERHVVLVRGGEPQVALCEGEVVYLGPALAAAAGLPLTRTRRAMARDVPALFDHLGRLLAERDTTSDRTFLVANFDSRSGFPRRIIRRVKSRGVREEWNVAVWKAGELAEKAPRGKGVSP